MNLRPLGPEGVDGRFVQGDTGCDDMSNDAEELSAGGADVSTRSHAQPNSAPVRTNFTTHLLPQISSSESRSNAERLKLISVKDASRLLGVSRATIYKLVASGQLLSIRVGTQIRIGVAIL